LGVPEKRGGSCASWAGKRISTIKKPTSEKGKSKGVVGRGKGRHGEKNKKPFLMGNSADSDEYWQNWGVMFLQEISASKKDIRCEKGNFPSLS